jgi:hypothetical protein
MMHAVMMVECAVGAGVPAETPEITPLMNDDGQASAAAESAAAVATADPQSALDAAACDQSAASTPTPAHSPPPELDYAIGMHVTALDMAQQWLPAIITQVDPAARCVTVHFPGWCKKFDEVILLTDDRLRPINPAERQPGSTTGRKRPVDVVAQRDASDAERDDAGVSMRSVDAPPTSAPRPKRHCRSEHAVRHRVDD